MGPWDRLLPMLAPLVLGAVAGRLGAFPDATGAITALNRYVLTFAFPALMFGAVARAPGSLPSAAFVLAHGAIFAAGIACAAGLGRLLRDRPARGALALGGLFGNVVYLGLPVVEGTLGSHHLPAASVGASIHMGLALLVGPALLVRWGGDEALPWSATARRVAAQPLVWAPLVGLAARGLPPPALEAVWLPLDAISRSASPVALFLLGLYLWVRRADVRRLDTAAAAILACKLAVLPAAALATALLLTRVAGLQPAEARVLLVLAAAPVAITTFSIAHEHGLGEQAIAKAIVASTLASLVTFALGAHLALTLWPPS
ncbi:MAG: hypothetical protein AMXMBFR64_19080 [Myxococcales bacterium]